MRLNALLVGGAVLGILLFAACGETAARSARSAATPPAASPTADPATAAYFAVIDTDGHNYQSANNAGIRSCNPGEDIAHNRNCGSDFNLSVAAALQKLQSDLARVAVPAQWQSQDQIIRSSLPVAISDLTAVARAYDAGDNAAFISAQTAFFDLSGKFETALSAIDPGLSFG